MTENNQQILAQLKETFQMFDVDGDGCITIEELKTVMKKLGYNTLDSQLQKMLNEMDKDQNGTVQLNEFLEVMSKQTLDKNMDQNSQLLATFRLFDKNGDGLISAIELKQGLQILGDKGQKIKEQDIKQLLDAADIDGDGHINFEQFVRMLKLK